MKKEEPLYNYGWCKGNVVLPKEEPKQYPDSLCDFCPLEKKGGYGVDGGYMAGCEGSKCEIAKENYDKHQETLEEVAKECLRNNSLPTEGDFAEGYITGSIFGAKWQQEQDNKMYSEEEVNNIVEQTIEKFYKRRYADKTKVELKDLWFKQFKK